MRDALEVVVDVAGVVRVGAPVSPLIDPVVRHVRMIRVELVSMIAMGGTASAGGGASPGGPALGSQSSCGASGSATAAGTAAQASAAARMAILPINRI